MPNKLIDATRLLLKNHSSALTRPLGFTLLDKASTNQLLTDCLVYDSPSQTVDLPDVFDFGHDLPMYEPTVAVPTRAKVWRYPNTNGQASLSHSGIVKIGANVLNTDFGTNAFYRDFLTVKKKKRYETNLLIAPWSHTWCRYYDYLFYVLTKLCRIRAVLGEASVADALISYPLLNTPFEAEYLDLLGIDRSRVVDSRTSDIQFENCVFGNNDDWFCPNYQDILALRQQVLDRATLRPAPKRRIYIRRATRRRVVNEDDLIRLLQRYDFDIIDDRVRTVEEQINLYRNASFIIGPHGASFANILWCDPQTHLMELFAEQYVPGFYRYLAGVLSLTYSAYCDGPFDKPSYKNVDLDIVVSIEKIEKALNQLVSPVAC